MNKALVRLMAGFRRFKEKYFQEELENSIYRRLASSGQTPKTFLIGCSDSRVDPAILTGALPGELFVVRNVANLVPPCEPSAVGFHGTSSALEFAVVNLKVENIIILGHRQCGGIRALMRGPQENPDSFVSQWMNIAKDARKVVMQEHGNEDEETRIRYAEMESIKVSLRNLMTFPFVREAVESGQLSCIGVYFDLEEGELWEFDQDTNKFRQLELTRHGVT
ncbi:carbonic anhydrase [Bdellovibrio reynosensis]|uniref:Carbonic anhydrase n=1 Tax=Bdellovibrio reynosensis TaxID=2835041 RepID=A0ABY4C9Q9_9BACT|nr:carbonic anhydrase [Bdellovibrio reynosensis]UOF00647.1 carbonic anhydrase [Bdellovibrio reynosensis]